MVLSFLSRLAHRAFAAVGLAKMDTFAKDAEILVLRHQLAVQAGGGDLDVPLAVIEEGVDPGPLGSSRRTVGESGPIDHHQPGAPRSVPRCSRSASHSLGAARAAERMPTRPRAAPDRPVGRLPVASPNWSICARAAGVSTKSGTTLLTCTRRG